MHLQAQLGCLLHIRIMATAPPPPPSKSQSNDECYPEAFGNVFFHNKIRWLVVVMVVANIKYSITACPGDQVLPIAQSGSKQTRPRITGKYYKSILPTPKYIGKGRAIPSFLFHFSCLLFSAATTIAGHFFLLCHPQRGNGAP